MLEICDTPIECDIYDLKESTSKCSAWMSGSKLHEPKRYLSDVFVNRFVCEQRIH